MPATPWKNKKEQGRYEAQFPARFTAGAEFVEISRLARSAPTFQYFTSEEWSAINPERRLRAGAKIYAAGAWAERNAYEQQRLAGKYLSLVGQDTVRAAKGATAIALRGCRDSNCVRSLSLAIRILDSAAAAPDKRPTWSALMKATDLLTRRATTKGR